ncbi:MAG: outer membrane protein [Candidatus Rokuibacteriota bacterium]
MRRLRLGLIALAALGGTVLPAAAQPTGWVTVGGQAAFETGPLSALLGIEGGARVGAGLYLLRLGPVVLGADAELTAGRLTADFGTAKDKITVYRGRAGIRATWWVEDDEPYLVPYVRIGAAYRRDRGDFIQDDGFGWFIAVGIDYRLSDTWSIGPFAAYEITNLSIDAESVLVGIGFTFSY